MIGVLELSSKIKYGMTSRNPMYLFRPFDPQFSISIVGSSHEDLSSNVIALVTVDPDQIGIPRGVLVRILGKCGDMETEELAILFKYATNPWKKFDISQIIQPSMDRQLLKGTTMNIDPEGCTDIDDVITIGEYFYITIADVAEWFNLNKDILFKKAYDICQTFYKDGKQVVSLLPIEQECSLLPGKERLGISLRVSYDLKDVSFHEVKVINNITYTYDTVKMSDHSSVLQEMASKMAGREINDPHEWVEQFMLFYNTEAAKVLVSKKRGLLRSHSEPDSEKLKLYESLGIDAKFLAYKSAKYTPAINQEKHWGLDRFYCHASSPIRRFADIVNQFVLKGLYLDVNEERLNYRNSCAKKYERELFFLREIQKRKNLSALIVSENRVWVPEWKRLVTYKNDKKPGTTGVLYYSLDMEKSTWKRRMLFRFEDISSLVLLPP